MRSPACLLLIALTGLTSACAQSKAPAAPSSAAFDQWADNFAADWVRASPQEANRLKYFTGAEQDALDRDLSLIGEWDYAYGKKGWEIRATLAKRGLAELDAFDPKTLSSEQQTSTATIRWT